MIDDPLIGRRLANFQIERPLGRGGMAQVYYGQDIKLRRPVAIKVIDARYRNNPTYAERFVREAQSIATWRHEHVIQIYYADDEDGFYYYVMEYIDGLNLEDLLVQYKAKDKLLPYDEVLRIGRAVAQALDYAHKRGVIHRDVKPTNVLVAHDGRVVLTDFGLAMDVELGSIGEAFGSAHYIAPEQARHSADAVPQSDLYSLGVILYEMLTGKVPFHDPSATAVAIQHLTLPPPAPRAINPKLNPETETVLLKALHKSSQERYQTGSALIKALAQALQASSPPATSTELADLEATIPRSATGRVNLAKPPELSPPVATASTTAAPTAAVPRPLLYAGVGIGVVVLLLLLMFLAVILWLRGGSQDEGAGATQVASTDGTPSLVEPALAEDEATATPNLIASETASDLPLDQTPTASPTLTPPPTPVPTPTQPLEPQLLVDTFQDFSTGKWEYLWSPPGKNEWAAMQYDQRRYGPCWYAQDYIRICQDSGHPGNGADIAWRWTSDTNGHILVFISARKIDRGGDGVTILAYLNGQAVQGLKLEPRDTQGVVNKNFFEADVEIGDLLTFVMTKNGGVEYDHTAVQVQIYKQ